MSFIPIALPVLVEILAHMATESQTLRAVLIAVTICLSTLFLVANTKLSRNIRLRKLVSLGTGIPLAATILTGLYACIVGVLNRNDFQYLLGDGYHYFVETSVMAVCTIIALQATPEERLRKYFAWLAAIAGVIGIAGAAAGTLGLPVASGNIVPALGVFRIAFGRGFPIFLLILLVAITWPKRRLAEYLAIGILLVALFLTLKRSQWLCFLGAFVVVALVRRVKIPIWLGGLMIGVVALFAAVTPFSFYERVGEALTYNEAYTVSDTIQERVDQLSPMLAQIQRQPLGMGAGATFETYHTRQGEVDDVHYLHNAYIFVIAQCGIIVGMLYFIFLAMPLLVAFRRAQQSIRDPWPLASLASMLVFLVLGVAMVPMHTVQFGIALGVLLHFNSRRHVERGLQDK